MASEKARLWPLLRQRTWQKHALVLLMSGLGFGLMFTFSQPFALSVGQENLRGFFVAFACTAAVVRLGLGRMVDRVGHRQIAFVALLFYGLVVAAMCTLTVGRLEALGALFGLVHGLFIPAFTALVVHESEPHERGSVLALFNGFFNLGSFVVVVLAVPVTRFGYPVVFAGSGAAIALSPLLLLRRKA